MRSQSLGIILSREVYRELLSHVISSRDTSQCSIASFKCESVVVEKGVQAIHAQRDPLSQDSGAMTTTVAESVAGQSQCELDNQACEAEDNLMGTWKLVKQSKRNFNVYSHLLYHKDKVLRQSPWQLVLPQCRKESVINSFCITFNGLQ